ncbi:MAG: sensor histidine kinase [Lacrimispora saccharolytica]
MKLFANYLKKNVPIFLWTVCFLGMFVLVCFLYGVPVQPAFYTAQVSVVFGILTLTVGFFRFRRKWKELAKAKEDILYTEELPKAETVIEKEYQEIVAELKKKMSELEEKDQSSYREMIEYYTMWAHQIKTPIAAMRLLLQQEESDKNRELLSELFKIEQYVLMVLQYLRLGSESNDLVLKRQSLDDIIRQAVKKYAPLFIRKKLTLVYTPVNCQVLTDEKWLEFVLEQILSNAIKYTKRGSVAIYMDEQAEKTLVIADTGIGIAAEDIPRVFEKGYTGGNGRYEMSSTGIGLYLCRRALNRLSHTIRIESELGQGTRVYINLETVHLDSD